MAERGHQVTVLHSAMHKDAAAMREIIKTWDVLHFLGPADHYDKAAPEIRERAGALVVDLDDDVWVWLEDPARDAAHEMQERVREALEKRGIDAVVVDRNGDKLKGAIEVSETKVKELESWLRAADLVTTTTPYLAARIVEHVPEARVRVVPNAVAPEMQRSRPRPRGHAAMPVAPRSTQPTPNDAGRNKPCSCGSGKKWKVCHGAVPQAAAPLLGAHVCGWTGSVAHLADLPPVLDALTRVRSVDGSFIVRSLGPVDFMQAPGFREVFSGTQDYSPVVLKDQRTGARSLQVPFEHYYDALEGMNADLAVIPMRDSPFNRGKSAVTLYSWAVQGVPVVCSRTGPYAEAEREGFPAVYVTHGNVDEWTQAIRDLIYEEEKRRALADAAQQWVMARHSFPEAVIAWEDAWAEARANREAAKAKHDAPA
jgi:glycosyltransferase involved in cell wall biosynthesis